jgi:signal transduction histidine kinase
MKANARTFEEDRMNDRYIAHLTHDIVGHLAAIQSCLGVALTGTLDKQSSEFVQRAYNRTCKLTNFIQMLIKLDKKIRQNGKMETSIFPLEHTVNNVIDALRSKAGENSIQLRCSASDNLNDIHGNEPSIEEMLTNILLIAINNSKNDGEILVHVTNQLNSVQLEISFARVNIPAIERTRKFDLLYQTSSVLDTDKAGSDLGWIMAKYIVEIHGGKIVVNSKKAEQVTITSQNEKASHGIATNVSINILHANRTFPSNLRISFKIRIYRNSLILPDFVVYIVMRNSFSGYYRKAVTCFVQ